MADDLEPNFLLDQNVSLASDDELGATADAQPITPHRSLEDEDDFALEGEWNGLTTQGSPSQDTEDPKATKKRKKKERQKENKAKKRRLQEEQQQEEQEPSASGKVEAQAAPRDHPTGASANPANQSPADIAEYFIKMQHKTFGSGISALELADMLIPESSIIDASQYAKPRTKDTLPEFIRQVAPHLFTRLKDKPKSNGAPVAVIVAGAALRVADLVRSCRPLRGHRGGEIAKLFTKTLTDAVTTKQMGHAPTLVALTSSASSSPISFPLDPPTNLHSYASHLDIWTIDSLPGGLGDSKIPPTLSHQQLFAKHMKVAEQVEYLKQTAVSVAIGTPDRLGKLLSAEDGLKLTNLEYIILDLTHRDAKNRTLLDIPETRKEVFASLFGQGSTGSNGGKFVMEHVKDGKIKLLLY